MTINNFGRLNLIGRISLSFIPLLCISLFPPLAYSISVTISKPPSQEKILLSGNVTVKAKVSLPNKPEKKEKARIFWLLRIKNHGDWWIGTTKSEEEKTFSLSNIPFPAKNSSFEEVSLTAYCPDQIYEGTGDYTKNQLNFKQISVI